MTPRLPAGGPAPEESSGAPTGLKILVVSFRFPPYNSVGGVSVGKTVKYLVALGHEVRVLTARDQQALTTLPIEVDAHAVVATGWMNPMRLAEAAAGGRDRVSATGFSAGRAHQGLVHRVGRFYRSLLVPDKEIGWRWPALRAGRRLVEKWRPDVVYASAPPYTALLVARAIASRTGIPWVAGLRDLWSDNPYRGVRFRRFDRALESWILGSAAGVVVTTEEAADVIGARFGSPSATVMNGYDPDDVRERTVQWSSEELRVAYTGVLIHDRRDPTGLFRAMRALRAEGRTVVADFYGRDSALAATTAVREGVRDAVFAHGPIPYGESVQVQRNADLLLLLQWNDPAERGICPAKIFEYAAARRPVLGIGPDDGVVARLLKDHGMGVVLQRPEDIAGELRRWLDLKAHAGHVPDVASRPPEELSRARQVEKLARFLGAVARSPSTRAR